MYVDNALQADVSNSKASSKRFSRASTTAQWPQSIVHALTFCDASSFRARLHLWNMQRERLGRGEQGEGGGEGEVQWKWREFEFGEIERGKGELRA